MITQPHKQKAAPTWIWSISDKYFVSFVFLIDDWIMMTNSYVIKNYERYCNCRTHWLDAIKNKKYWNFVFISMCQSILSFIYFVNHWWQLKNSETLPILCVMNNKLNFRKGIHCAEWNKNPKLTENFVTRTCMWYIISNCALLLLILISLTHR